MKNTIGAALLLVTTVLSAQDLTMVTKTTGKVKSQATTYMTTNKTRSNDSTLGYDIVKDYQSGTTYVIDHKAKTISFMKVADMAKLAEYVAAHTPKGKGMASFGSAMNDMYGDPNIFKVENVGKDTVIGRSCNKTRITSGNQVWEYCVDPSLKLPVDPATMARQAAASYSSLAAYPHASKIMSNLMTATAALKGVPLKTHTSGFSGDTYTEVTSISQGSIPPSTFALPQGYAMKDQIGEMKKAMAEHEEH